MISPFDLAYYYTNPNIRFREHTLPTEWLESVGAASSVMEIPKITPSITTEKYEGVSDVILGGDVVNAKNVYKRKDPTTNIYNYLTNLDSKYIFLYAIIITVSIYIALHLPITGKGLIGLIVGLIISYIIARRNDYAETSRENQLNNEYNTLKIKPQYSQKYPEFIDFLYSIKELGDYNLDAYQQLIENLDAFLILYDDIKIGVQFCKENYDVALEKRNNALNHLHSIIFSLEANPVLIQKLNDAGEYLHKLMNKYLDNIIDICNKQNEIQGYNTNTRIIEKGPYPFNHFMTFNSSNRPTSFIGSNRATFTYDIY